MAKTPYNLHQKSPAINEAQVSNFAELMVMSALMSRAQMASVLGLSFGGNRDIYQTLGYDTVITWAQYCSQFERQGYARAVINRPVASTWRGGFKVVEASDDKETPIEKAWRDLEKTMSLTAMFARLDMLTGLGSYGVLLLGLSDVGRREDFAKEARGKLELKYLRPFSSTATEGDAQVASWVTDPANERYGRPETYRITLRNLSTGDAQDLTVHHSRVIHVIDGQGTSEVEGTPRLQAVWNNLKNLEKITGGSAEMYWKGAFPGHQFVVDKDYQMTQAMRDTLKDVFDEYEHHMRRILELQGGELKALAQQFADPEPAVRVQLQEISAVTGIPLRILTGSEVGELASTADRDNQADYVEDRQENFAGPRIVRATIDRFIELGVLPEPVTDEGYGIQWPDLREPSDKDRVDVGNKRADSIAKYAGAMGAEAVVPIKSFLRECLGLDEDQVTLIEEERQAQLDQEEKDAAAREAEAAKQAKENPQPQPPVAPVEPPQPPNPPQPNEPPVQ